jgi:F0F1-type ATP synthase membrane subunit b/b'
MHIFTLHYYIHLSSLPECNKIAIMLNPLFSMSIFWTNIGEALRKHLDKLKENEERMKKARKEHAEKVAKQQAERARSLGS